MSRRDIEFKAVDGTILRGWLYVPQGLPGKAPCVILSNGFSVVKEVGLDIYAEYFTTHIPIVALVFDNRCLGSSDGTPRFEIIATQQMSDIQDAITYAQTLDEVDPDKIAIWGASYAGGNVLQVSAVDRRAKAVIAVVPLISGMELFSKFVPPHTHSHLMKMFQIDRIARMKGEPAGIIPIVDSDPLGMAITKDPEAYEFFEKWGGKGGWENKVTIRSFELMRHHNPRPYIPLIAPTPVLFVIGVNDTVCPVDSQLAAFNEAREPKQLEMLSGGHYVCLDPVHIQKSGATQTEFLKKWLF